jgi:hypothetical protein
MRVLSMCAGQGRDLIGPLATHPRREDVRALVELDADNAEVAHTSAVAAGLTGVQAVVADAADPSTYHPIAPVDLALVCGVFGNIADVDIHRTIGYLPVALRPGGHVIWTRHREEPDLTPTIRDWFSRYGFTEVAFDYEARLSYGVGTHVLPARLRPGRSHRPSCSRSSATAPRRSLTSSAGGWTRRPEAAILSAT